MLDASTLIDKFHRGEYAACIAELDAAWNVAHAEASRQIGAGEEPAALVECVRLALLESGMRSWAATRTPSVVARAVEVGLWTPERALALAELVPEPDAQVKLMAAALGTGKLSDEQAHAAIDTAFAAARRREFVTAYDMTLNMLAGAAALYARDDVVSEVLKTALTAADSTQFAGNAPALYSLMSRLPEQFFDSAIQGLRVLKNAEARAWAIAELAPRLPEERRDEALRLGLDAVEGISLPAFPVDPTLPDDLRESLHFPDQNDVKKANALLRLGPHLTGELVERALQIGLGLAESTWFPRSVEGVAARLTPEQWMRVLDHTLTASSEWWRTDALMDAVEYARGETQRRAVSALCEIEDDETRTKIRTWYEENDIAVLIEDAASRTRLEERNACAIFRERKSPSEWFEAVVQTELDNEEERARSLAYMSVHLPDAVLPALVEHVLAMGERTFYHEWVLSGVVNRLDTPTLTRALTAKYDHQAGRDVIDCLHHYAKWTAEHPIHDEVRKYALDRILAIPNPSLRETQLAEVSGVMQQSSDQASASTPQTAERVKAERLDLLKTVASGRRKLRASVLDDLMRLEPPESSSAFSPGLIAQFARVVMEADQDGLGSWGEEV